MVQPLPTALFFPKAVFVLFLVCMLGSPAALRGQAAPCACNNCPLVLKDLFTGNFNITVQNVANPTLGQNGQDLCAVKIHFDHSAVCNLRIALTSPSGQTIILVGPIGGPPCTTMSTNGSDWDITFVRCSDPAAPDPGITPNWSNSQPWATNTNYTGTYYPLTGCFEQLAGPVNGLWSLSILDGLGKDTGSLYTFELIFCDPAGMECFNCAAEAGTLNQPDIVACQGDASFSLAPTYTNTAPPGNLFYTYKYLIADPTGVILDIVSTPDLSAYPPGNYTICGLSYYNGAAPHVPVPDGVLTVTQLRNALNTSTAPFCGDVTPNCVGVTIQAPPPDIEETAEICAPGCYEFYGFGFCQTGTYTVPLTDGICDYTGRLHLKVRQPKNTYLIETICAGSCSAHPLFPNACAAGAYEFTVQDQFGCDSIIHLNLLVLTVNAVIQQPAPVLTCAQPTAVLQGTGSTTGAGTTYQWSATNGGHIVGSNSGLSATVDKAGTYQLRVCRSQGGAFCCDTAVMIVTSTQGPPATPVISGSGSLCQGQSALFTVAALPNATTYTWTVPPDVVIDSGQGTDSLHITWNSAVAGSICVTASNLCGPSMQACMNVAATPTPMATQPQGLAVVCADSTVTYSIPAVPNANTYTWTVHAPATIASGQGSNTVSVHWGNVSADSVCVSVTGGCGVSAPVCLPVAIYAVPAAPVVDGPLTVCYGDTATYTVAAVAGASAYQWTVNGGTIIGGSGTGTVQVVWDGNAATGMVCARAASICGQSEASCVSVTIRKVPAEPTITGPSTFCTGATASYSVTNVSGATSYTWTANFGGSILSGQNTPSVTASWPNPPSGSICVTADNGCGPSVQHCLPVAVSQQPVAVAGPDTAVCGLTYNLSATPSVGGGLWTVLPGAPGAVTFGNAGAATTTATVVQSGAYAFLWRETNGACTDADTVLVQFNPLPVTGQVQTTCDGANQNYTVVFPVSGGTQPYTIPGGTFSGGTFTSNPIASGQTYTFSITDVNGCTAPAINGTFNCQCSTNAGQMQQQALSACPGSSVTAQHQGGTLDANDVAAYVLHTNNGTTLGTVLAENTTGTFSFGTGMTYGTTYYISYVAGNNVNGQPDPGDPCFSVAAGQPVIFYDNPIADAGTDDAVCGKTLPLTGNTGAGTGLWTVSSSPSGATGTIGNPQSAATSLTVSDFGVYTLTYTLTANGCTGSDDVTLTFHDSPVGGLVQYTCDGTNQNYTVGFPITGGTAPYTVDGNAVAGANFLSGPQVSGQPFTFTITDANGCMSPAIGGTYNCSCGTNAGQMSQQALSACPGSSVTAQHQGGTLDANDVAAYVLHTNSGTTLGTVLAQNATGTFSFGTGMTYGTTYYISYVVGNSLNGQPDPADPCFSVATGQPVTFFDNPTAGAGADGSICGLSSPLNGTGSGAGAWTVSNSPGGATGTISNPQSAATSLTVSDFGIYTLTYTLTANGCTGADDVTLTFNDSPLAGLIDHTCDGTNQHYTVSFPITGGTAPYSVGGVPVSGTNFLSAPQNNGQSFSFTITDANGCISPVINGSFNCNCATNAGQMTLTPLTVCENDAATGQYAGGENLDADDVSAWVLHTGAGTVLGTVLAQNQTGVFTFGNGMTYGTTYYISRVAGNNVNGIPDPTDPCFSVAQGQPVVFLEEPAPNAGATADVCGMTATLAAVNDGFTGVWSQVSGNGTAVFTTPNNPASPVTVDAAGAYVFRWTESNGVCTAADDVTIDFQEIPVINGLLATCNGTNTGYTVTYTVSGGVAPYTVSGLTGSFNGTTFTSNVLADNGTYSFTLSDANGCTTPALQGSHACNCATNAGTMLTTPATFCAGQPATATWNNNATLDADDAVQFILHNQSSAGVGTVFATNTQPTFNFGGGLQTGVVYYISAIAGNGNGSTIDLNDPCLSVAPGTPVQWKPLPNVTLSGDATICEGGNTVLNFAGAGVFPLQLSYSDGSANPLSLVLAGSTAAVTVSPTATTTYTLLSVADGTNPVCTSVLNATATVTVNTPVSAGSAAAPLEFCTGDNATVQLASLLTNADPGGQWTEISAVPSAPGAFNANTGTFKTSGQVAGTYQFRYSLTAVAPCPSDAENVSVILNATPVADAGPDRMIDCNQPNVSLGGSSGGSGLTYDWTLNGNTVGQSAQLTTTQAGTYNLLVTSSAGCTDEDQAAVLLDQDVPQAQAVVHPIKCFGDTNGSIALDSVLSTHPPVLFSINGGAFGPQSTFFQLAPGTYTVTLQAADGCEWSMPAVTLTQPAQLQVDLGAPIEALLGDSVHLTAQSSVPLSALQSVFWNPVLDPLHADTLIQNFLPLYNEQVTVRLTDANGCIATSSVQIKVDRSRHVYIGNSVRPGSSNFNDQLVVYGGRDVAEVESFRVYDRWGAQLFETGPFLPNDVTKGWNGKFRGKEVAPGVYVYYAVVRFVDGETEIFEGDVTVFR